MNPDKLKKRLHTIPATPYRKMSHIKELHRREENYIIIEQKNNVNVEFDDFFDLDREIDVARPARELVSRTFNGYGDKSDEPSFIEIKEIDESKSGIHEEKSITIVATPNPNNFNPILLEPEKQEVGHEYMQCSFEKQDGDRCKRQSLKNKDVCAIHKKYLEKNAS